MDPEERAAKCKTAEEAKNLIKNARARGAEDVVQAAERRLFELLGQSSGSDDPIARAVWRGVHAYEEIVLKAKHGRAQAAGRTRQFVKQHGPREALLLWATRKNPSDGFAALVAAGHPELTAEYMVAVTYASQFPEDARQNAAKRLLEFGIKI